jgi:aminopeptidase-like protein/aminoglycoside N3'-acetyltransferase
MTAPRGFTREDLDRALRQVGIAPGDTLFVHASAEGLGTLAGPAGDGDAALIAALRDAVGPGGTLLVPAYTFSFCRGEVFDVEQTPSCAGPWSTSAGFLERFRTQPGAVRSRDPIHSVAGIGPRAAELLRDVPPTCFGAGSVHERLLSADGKILLVGAPLEEASFSHHVEEIVGIPGRFKKLFTGRIRAGGVERKQGWVYYVRILADNFTPDASRLDRAARERGAARVAPLGAGELIALSCREFFDLTRAELERDPWSTVRGPVCDPVEAENARVQAPRFSPVLPSAASITQLIDGLWQLPRDLISDGYDAALDALAAQLPMTIHEYPSGTECWTWLIPEKWTCHEAQLETLDGKQIFSYADNPLHVVSYSLPFEGVVTREELERHLHVHKHCDDAVPYIFKYYERDWGLCCSRNVKASLRDDHYRVVIRTSFRYGNLRIGEVIAPGESEETVILSSHLCHPAMVNDDMTGVAVGMDVMRRLLARPRRRYTYRYLIVPETIGGVAYLSQNEHLIPKMKGGLFLEMLGLANPHALQLSFAGDTELDRVWSRALRRADPANWVGEFRTVIGNDERQFNGPGVRVPMLSLSRVLHASNPAWPYLEYHSSLDNPGLASAARLEESRDVILSMIDALEANRAPRNRFKGEAFCSRYGVFVDGYANPEGHRALFDVLFLIDGTNSIADIAERCGISFEAARATVDELHRVGLVEYES